MALVAKLKQLGQSAKLGGIKTHGPSVRKSLTHQRKFAGQVPNPLTTLPQVEGASAPLMSLAYRGTLSV